MPHYHIPHSQEWFKALQIYNPHQARQTQSILRKVGRDDVCSICGDHPVKDYQVVDQKLDENAVVTNRLCDDCHIIQGMQGIKFAPL